MLQEHFAAKEAEARSPLEAAFRGNEEVLFLARCVALNFHVQLLLLF
jgi:hypothetical protein